MSVFMTLHKIDICVTLGHAQTHTHTRKDIHAQPAWTMPYDFRNQNRLTNKPLLSGRTQSNAIPDICLSTHWRALRWNYEMWNECAAKLYLQHDTCKYWIHIWFMPRSFWNIFSWYTFRIGQKKCNWKTRIISHTIPSFTLLPSDCVCVCVWWNIYEVVLGHRGEGVRLPEKQIATQFLFHQYRVCHQSSWRVPSLLLFVLFCYFPLTVVARVQNKVLRIVLHKYEQKEDKGSLHNSCFFVVNVYSRVLYCEFPWFVFVSSKMCSTIKTRARS